MSFAVLTRFSSTVVLAMALFSCTTFRGGHHFTVEKDIVYKTVDGVDLKSDLYLPDGDGLRPAVIVVHGGGWNKRSGDMESVCRDLAREGFVALNITYRLAPESHYPKPVDDVKDAITWLKTNAPKYHVDANKLAGWGYSAGSNLILLASLDTDLGLKAVVTGGTPSNLISWPHSPLVYGFLGYTSQSRPDLWKVASPVNHVTSTSPPLFLYHGEWDSLVEPEQMQFMVDAMKKQNRIVETHTVSYMGHAAVYLFSQESVDLGIAFIQKNLNSSVKASTQK